MTGAGFTERIARFIATSPRQWPAEAEREAVRAILDTIGCMIAGSREPVVHRVLNGVRRWGGRGRARTAIREQLLDPPWAALVNGTAAHALDFDDAMEVAQAHGSAALVPALLALGVEMGSSGRDLIDAFIVGTEFLHQLGLAMNKAHYAKGWHCTSTIGTPAVAAACARLLRLDPEGVRNAIALATSLSGGLKCQFGTDAKPLHAGLAAQNGMLAARLAASGISAGASAYEGRFGFGELMGGDGVPGFGNLPMPSNEDPAILRPGLWLKLYPCCASAHRALDALDELRRAHDIRHGDIETVTASVYEIGAQNLAFPRPENEQQAKFSLPYCLAALMMDGSITLGSFSRSQIRRLSIQRALPTYVMTVDPEQPVRLADRQPAWTTVTVLLKNGVRHQSKVVFPKGHPRNRLSDGELDRKFLESASSELPDENASWLLCEIREMSRLDSVDTLMNWQ